MSIRTERVAALIKVEIGYIIEKYLRGEIRGIMTVTSVSMSPDLKNAKIYISIFNQEGSKEEIINKLNHNKKHIKSILAKRVHLKFLPELYFFNDESFEQVAKLEKIFEQIHRDEHSAK